MESFCISGSPSSVRVVVAMSGGVDSSVVAGLLKYAGYDVVGVTLQLYDQGDAAVTVRKKSCCAGQDVRDARQVSSDLGIPHYVLDYEKSFRDSVITPFVEGYVAGETPLPCVACNQTVKFRDLLNVAREVGAKALATGHYVMSRPGSTGMEMYRPADLSHDQSYFLFATTKEQLAFLRFPLGAYTKSETREFAKAMGISVSEKPDSQDICFVSQGRYSSLVFKLRPDALKSGEIVHVDGRVIGTHNGIVDFTVGQRRGIGIGSAEPLYVIRIDATNHRVIVGPRSALATERVWLRNVNWLGEADVLDSEAEVSLFVRFRSSSEVRPATIRFFGDRDFPSARVDISGVEEGIACGQACVFYSLCDDMMRVMGGGWINRTESDSLQG